MSPIKDFQLVYDALNAGETFSEGDTVTGTLSFNLTKDTKVKCLKVKAKGDADVRWTEGMGDDSRTYSAKKRYFKLQEFLIAEDAKGTVLPQGSHCFKFSFKIPQGDLPMSFKGDHGKIVYMLEAKFSRRWRWPSRVQREIKLLSNSLPCPGSVTCPQSGSVVKEMGMLSKGSVEMFVNINTDICCPGDTLSVVAKINNSSSKKMKPKFSLLQYVVYKAGAATTASENILCKMVGEEIPAETVQTVSTQITVPIDVPQTLHNCELLSIDYCVKVYLDISFATDPEVMFLLVVCPPRPNGMTMGPNSDFLPSNLPPSDFPPSNLPPSDFPPSNLPPPNFPPGPGPVPAASGAYAYPVQDHTQYSNTSNGSNNQAAASYGFSTAATSSMQHQAPTAPPSFPQTEAPPAYMSIVSPPQPAPSNTLSDHKN